MLLACDESERLVRERFNGRLNCKLEGNEELYAKYGVYASENCM